MKLTDLQETAGLARLGMNDPELQEMYPAFEQMFCLFDTMQNAEKDPCMTGASLALNAAGKIVPVSRIVDSGFFRTDNDPPLNSEELTESLLSKAWERDSRFVVIPNVL